MTRNTVWLALAALAACGDGASEPGQAATGRETAEAFDHFGEQLERAREAEAAARERKEKLDEALEGDPR